MSGSWSPTTYILESAQVSATGQIMADITENCTHFAWQKISKTDTKVYTKSTPRPNKTSENTEWICEVRIGLTAMKRWCSSICSTIYVISQIAVTRNLIVHLFLSSKLRQLYFHKSAKTHLLSIPFQKINENRKWRTWVISMTTHKHSRMQAYLKFVAFSHFAQ